MKKRLSSIALLSGSFLLVGLLLFISCEKQTTNESLSNLNGSVTAGESANLVTAIAASSFSTYSGIDSIVKTSATLTTKSYRIVGGIKIVNNIAIGLDSAVFTITNNTSDYTIALSKSNIGTLTYVLDKSTKKVYRKVGSTLTLIDANFLSSNLESTRFFASITIFSDVMNSDGADCILVGQGATSKTTQSCDRTIVSLNSSKSASVGGCSSATNTFISAHPDCHTVYGVDSGCLWGDYMCVSSQAITCNGSGCDVGYGQL